MRPKLPILALATIGALTIALFVGAESSSLFTRPTLHDIALAQTADTPTPVPTPEQSDDSGVQNLPPIEGKLNPPQYPNMDSNLNRIVQQVETGQFSAQAAAANAPIQREESVAVTLYITEGYADAIAAYLESNGASPRNIGSDYIEAYIPVSLLAEASQQEGVSSIRTIIPPQPAQGVVASEGAAAHGAPAWHAAGYRGQGVKIGIIDLGFEGFRSLMGSELPATVQARCYTDMGVFTFNFTDCDNVNVGSHGTEVIESLFDIAPEATYYISNPNSGGDMRNTVAWMIDHDVDVINMSLTWTWSGPGDGTSPFSNSALKSVDTAVDGGMTWLNPAGNAAKETWFGPLADADSNGWHNFQQRDECNSVILKGGERFIAQLRWDDAWGGATRDLDIYLYDILLMSFNIRARVASSENSQSGDADHDPSEKLTHTPILDGEYCLAVRQFGGAAPEWIQLISWSGQNLEHYTVHHSIKEPADSANPGLLAVGAAPWDDTITIEDFSSRGPTTDGRIKPDIVGADGVYLNAASGGMRVFGTSIASPHVAGLAALVKQRFPEYTPQQITNYLKTHAHPRGTVPNNTWGYGFARPPAPASVPTPDPTPDPTPSPMPTDACIETLTGSAAINGAWASECVSIEPPASGTGDRYARFYAFTLTEASDVTVTLESAADTYLYLRQGTGRGGTILRDNDDHDRNEFALSTLTDSGISETLAAGEYTIEAATYRPETTGDFTLTVTIAAAAAPPTPPAPTAGYVDVSRGYDHACALHSDGSIICWGANDMGQATPPSSGRFTTVSSDYKGSCAVRDDGAVLCWGSFTVSP